MIVALQSVASRNVDPLKQAVVSVCMLRSDTEAHNVIPQSVVMNGTVRTLDADVRELAQTRVQEIIELTARAHGCVADINYMRGYPATVNHGAETDYAAEAVEVVSPNVDRSTPPIMAGEDFSYMLEERPGAYIMLGNGDGANVHHPAYDFNDEAIPAGCSWFAEVVERRLPIT